jgi:hypothetical protein
MMNPLTWTNVFIWIGFLIDMYLWFRYVDRRWYERGG